MSNDPWLSRRVRKARPGETHIGAYGGHPRGVRAQEWPRCAVCGAPMCFMAQVDAGPWVDLGPYKRISVFICHATGGRCEDWDPWKGANRVLLQDRVDDNLYDGPPTVRVYRRTPVAVDSEVHEGDVMARVQARELAMAEALEQLRVDKLGGGAVWLHSDDTPQSPSGQGRMRLVLQLTTEVVKFDITPGGMGYVFIDPYDPTPGAGRLLWQGG